MSITRRRFMQNSALATTALSFPMVASSRVLGANDEIRVAVVGCGGRGTGAHIPSFQGQQGVTVVAVSDPDRGRMGGAAKMIESKYQRKVDQYVDVRTVFEQKDIDVIGNA